MSFHYSGHGSQVVDTHADEVDRKDETICPHDFVTAGMITDDDFRTVLAALPVGVNRDVILDSCHSGTGTWEQALLATLPEEQSLTYRYIKPPLDWGYFVDVHPAASLRHLLKPHATVGTREAVEVPGLNHVW